MTNMLTGNDNQLRKKKKNTSSPSLTFRVSVTMDSYDHHTSKIDTTPQKYDLIKIKRCLQHINVNAERREFLLSLIMTIFDHRCWDNNQSTPALPHNNVNGGHRLFLAHFILFPVTLYVHHCFDCLHFPAF